MPLGAKNSGRLSPHFSEAELGCRCGCGFLPPPAFVEKLERLRVALGRPMIVTSGARCPEHNQRVGGARHSAHLEGRAVDVRMAGTDAARLVRIAALHGFDGIGLRQHGERGGRFVHVDDVPSNEKHSRPAVWTYE